MNSIFVKIRKNQIIDHLFRAGERYGDRNGPLLAAAVTYFSVLSLVPILIAVISVAGLLLMSLWPDALDLSAGKIFERFGSRLLNQFSPIVEDVRSGFGSVGAIALAIALWVGTMWIRSLRRAIVAQIAPDLGDRRNRKNIFLEFLVNLGTFVVFIVLTIATFAVTTLSVSFNENLVSWIGLSEAPLAGVLVGVVALVGTALAGMVLFLYLFWVLSDRTLPTREWLIGSFWAGTGLTVLQSLAGLVTSLFSRNLTARILGPVIVVMLFFNLYATLIMYVAAWIGTSAEFNQLEQLDDVESVPANVSDLEPITLRIAPWPSRATGTGLREHNNSEPPGGPIPDPTILLPQDVAAKGVRAGAAVGYGFGAAAGMGLGVALGSLKRRFSKESPES